MTYYLIDYENVKNICGIETLSEDDAVCFFYSQNANSLTFELHRAVMQTAARVEYFLIENGGKNALDFQLSSYVGYLLAQDATSAVVIVSNDKGFSNVASFWQMRGEDRIALQRNIIVPEKTSVTQERQDDTPSDEKTEDDSVAQMLEGDAHKLGLEPEEIEKIAQIVKQYKTTQAINNNLMKLLRDSNKVGRITKLIKPLLKHKN